MARRASANPSSSLRRAVAREHGRLLTTRERIDARATTLRASLADLEREIAEIDEQIRRLEGLDDSTQRAPAEPTPRSEQAPPLRGRALREAAAGVLAAQTHGHEIHYRKWFALVLGAGHRIAGQDPLASFLTNASRSPIVTRGDESGTYRIDLTAVDRLGAQLSERRAELADLLQQSLQRPSVTSASLAHERHLTTEIGRLERALAEAQAVLGSPLARPALRSVS